MEDNKKLEINNISQIICQECGLPLKLFSYKENQTFNSEKIQIKLKCQNSDHIKLIEMEFEEYYNLIKNNPDEVFKCMICKNYIVNNKIPFYCYNCKQIICMDCLTVHKNKKNHIKIEEFSKLKFNFTNHHINSNDINLKNDDFTNINELIFDLDNNIIQIQKEMDDLLKKNKMLENKKKFLEFLKINNNLSKDNNNNSINSSMQLIDNINSYINKNIINYPINIIYHNVNDKINLGQECENFRKETKGSIILSDDLINLELILKYIIKNNKKNKFFLIVNGRSAKKAIDFIDDEKNNYRELFINSFIFTRKKNNDNYNNLQNIQNEHKNFVKAIFTDPKELIQIIDKNFRNIYNEEYYINSIINEDLFNEKYLNLSEELSSYYGKNPPNLFLSNIKDFLKNSEFPDEIINHVINKFEAFTNNFNNYENVISNYLNDFYFMKIINYLLNKKEISIFKKIGYYAGNLIYSLVEYGKKNNKRVNEKKTFYCGMELNIIEMMEFLKNKKKIIAFPYFLSMTTNENLAKKSSKKDRPVEERKDKELYSVIMEIKYTPHKDYESCIFDVKDLSLFPDDQEYILLPFTFMRFFSINIKPNECCANIILVITKSNLGIFKK